MLSPPDHFADLLSWGEKWQSLKKLVAQWVRKTLVAKRKGTGIIPHINMYLIPLSCAGKSGKAGANYFSPI